MAQKTGRKRRVVWTEDELAQVITEAVRLSLQDREFIWSFIAKGQRVLTEERRRFIAGRNAISTEVANQFCRERQEILETGVPFPVNIEKEVLVERPRKALLESITTRELFDLLANRFVPIIDALPALLQKSDERSVVSEAEPSNAGIQKVAIPAAPVARKPRVLLFGFLPGQERELTERAKGFNLDLMFQKKEGRQAEPPPSCRWCVVMKKVGHPAWHKLKDHFGDSTFLVEGITQAMKTLADINAKIGYGTP